MGGSGGERGARREEDHAVGGEVDQSVAWQRASRSTRRIGQSARWC